MVLSCGKKVKKQTSHNELQKSAITRPICPVHQYIQTIIFISKVTFGCHYVTSLDSCLKVSPCQVNDHKLLLIQEQCHQIIRSRGFLSHPPPRT